MLKHYFQACAFIALTLATATAQQNAPASVPSLAAPMPLATPETPAPIEPPIQPTTPTQPEAVRPPTATTPETTLAPVPATTNLGGPRSATGGAINEFQGDDIAVVLRSLARQSKLNLVISDKLDQAAPPIKVTMRLEDKTPLEAMKIIVNSKGLFMDVVDGVYYIKTADEKQAEPTESAFFTLSYASADKVVPLLTTQLISKSPPQFDTRTNTIFYREAKSNMEAIKLFLETIDKPTPQVMIEARLVEVTTNPKQGYGLNWAGTVGGVDQGSEKKFTFGGNTNPLGAASSAVGSVGGAVPLTDFVGHPKNGNPLSGVISMVAPQFAILTAQQMSVTMRLLNQDADAEFLANPRVVTANNEEASIKITRNQPVPQLNFNEQTATAVFGGFQDKEFGNTLKVKPSINKDDYVTLNVQPEISNKVGDSTFAFAGAVVSSPIIDKRTLNSNVLIKSGDTLAIGGLLQDEGGKQRSKVPVLGDIPIIGYAFQERINARAKRNLLVFVTPTLIKQGYGTGLENQVNGLHHSGEEYADPNGWRNNAKGAIRLTPTSNRQNAADYPKPGVAPAPRKVSYKVSAADRER